VGPGHFVEPCRKSSGITHCADFPNDLEPYILSHVFGLVFCIHETAHIVVKWSFPELNEFLQGPRLAPSMLKKQKFAFNQYSA
jgi:hypothetical protein